VEEFVSSSLVQLQLAYDQVQDRLLLTLQTQDFNEYRFWITRRLVVPLWNILLQLLNADKKGAVHHKHESRQIAEKIRQEKKQHQATADKLSHRITRRPFGNEPLLLVSVRGQQDDQGISLLELKDLHANSLACKGDSTIITALCQLILQTVQAADWSIDLNP
jgi:hypothetical protein